MKAILRLLLCFAASVVSLVLAGTIIHLLQLHPAQAPGNPTVSSMVLLGILSKVVLVAGLYPLARGLAGSTGQRVAAWIAFLALATGLNTMIEASIFTNYVERALPAVAVMYAAEALLLGGALGFLFGHDEPASGLGHRDWPGWMVRGVAAWLAFPVVYLIFGIVVAPVVSPYYRAGVAGLHIPPLPIILETQLVRSAIFLAASLPLIALWEGSRKALWLCLGLAHATVTGLYGLVGNAFFPPVLRITHGLEITADSFVYAAVLVLLFTRPRRTSRTEEPGSRTGRSQLTREPGVIFQGGEKGQARLPALLHFAG